MLLLSTILDDGDNKYEYAKIVFGETKSLYVLTGLVVDGRKKVDD